MLNVIGLHTEYVGTKGVVVKAAQDVSFDVPEGKLFTLLGPSGCGKTTTLRSIAGLEKPVAGSITVNGNTLYSSAQKIFIPPNKRGFGMVFQSYAIWPHMTVFQNASFPLEVGKKSYSKSEIDKRVMRVLESVELDHLRDRDATRLSGGQQQRLALARALVMEPQLLLLDEPLSNLDSKLRDKMRFELKRLQRELNITTIYVTHDQSEALALSHEIAVMKDGRIVQRGNPRSIYENPQSTFVADFVGTINFVKATVRAMNGANGVVLDTEIGTLHIPGCEGCAVGDEIVVCIRPENIQLSDAALPSEPVNHFAATVSAKVFLGEVLDFQVTVGSKTLLVRTHPSQKTPVGDAIHFTVSPADCIALKDNVSINSYG